MFTVGVGQLLRVHRSLTGQFTSKVTYDYRQVAD